MDELRRAAGYARVSTAADTQDGSYETQVKYLKEYIKKEAGVKFVKVYGDHGRSGRYIGSRPGMKKLIEEAENGLIQVIYCKSLSRFARNMREALETIRRLKGRGVDLVFLKEGFDTRVMGGELILSIMAAISESEADSISENLKHSQHKAVMGGKVWRKPPYGFRRDQEGNWVIEEGEASHVRMIFSLAAEGMNYSAIARRMNELEEQEGSGRDWSRFTVVSTLKSEAYIGDYLTNKKCIVIERDGSRRRVKNAGIQNQYYIEEHHTAIISRQEFDRVNRLMQEKSMQAKHKGAEWNG